MEKLFLKDLDHAYKVIDDMQKKLNVAQRFVRLLKCHSCPGYYADGYVCDCGRDHSYTDKEWAEYEDQKNK